MGEHEGRHLEFGRLRPDARRVGVIVEDELQVWWSLSDLLEPHCLVHQYIRASGERGDLVAHERVAGNRNDAVRRLDPESDGGMDGLVTDLAGQHSHVASTPDLRRLVGKVEGNNVEREWITAVRVGSAHVEIVTPGVQHLAHKRFGGTGRNYDRKWWADLAAGHDPAGQDKVLQPGEVIAVMMRDEDCIDLGVRQAGAGKALDRRAARIELEPQTVNVDEHAGTGTLGGRDRAARSGERHGGGQRLPPSTPNSARRHPVGACRNGRRPISGRPGWERHHHRDRREDVADGDEGVRPLNTEKGGRVARRGNQGDDDCDAEAVRTVAEGVERGPGDPEPCGRHVGHPGGRPSGHRHADTGTGEEAQRYVAAPRLRRLGEREDETRIADGTRQAAGDEDPTVTDAVGPTTGVR